MKFDSKHLNWGALSAVLVLVGIAGYHFFAPMPDSVRPEAKKTPSELESDKKDKMKELSMAEAAVNAKTWQVPTDEVSPAAMAWVSKKAQENYIAVSAFRPQRSVDAEGLVQLNYLVTIEAPYLNVMKFVSVFEQEDSLLAIKAVQLATVDGATDLTRATIALVAYSEAKNSG